MNEADIIYKYFPKLSDLQRKQIEQLGPFYREWNEKINLISRKDIDNLYEHHVLHSLAIAKSVNWRKGTRVLDFGTGGGFPGIPLAIFFPEVSFKLIDGTGKKVGVADLAAKTLGLENVETEHVRGEELKEKFDFVVSRAVMPLPDLARILKKNITPHGQNALPNGIIVLKGGDISAETRPFKNIVQVQDLDSWFEEPWFKEKHVIYVPA